ncbi:MAG: AAA family ATPase [Phycisphaerales bacterium]|nr:AAA family ATPase [Phycisphaerales bacterium]
MPARTTRDIAELADACAALRRDGAAPAVGVSGVDGAGKTWLCARLASSLEARGVRTLTLGVDAWRTAPEVRFRGPEWASTFYERAYRWDEARAALDAARRSSGAGLILFEGVFALTNERRPWFDLTVWVDCPPATALERALARNQEGRGAEALADEYDRVYQPAQRLHFERDRPAERVDWRFVNG